MVKNYLAYIVLAFGTALGLFFSYQADASLQTEIEQRCLQSQAGRQVLRDIIIHNDSQLGKPGTAGFRYYKEHPEELDAAHRSNGATLAKLPVIDCEED